MSERESVLRLAVRLIRSGKFEATWRVEVTSEFGLAPSSLFVYRDWEWCLIGAKRPLTQWFSSPGRLGRRRPLPQQSLGLGPMGVVSWWTVAPLGPNMARLGASATFGHSEVLFTGARYEVRSR